MACPCFQLMDDVSANERAKFLRTYYAEHLSGICRFVDDVNPNSTCRNHDQGSTSQDHGPDYVLKKFIVLNFDGVYNFKYNPEHKSFIQNKELENCYTNVDSSDCMERLLSCIYEQILFGRKCKIS